MKYTTVSEPLTFQVIDEIFEANAKHPLLESSPRESLLPTSWNCCSNAPHLSNLIPYVELEPSPRKWTPTLFLPSY